MKIKTVLQLVAALLVVAAVFLFAPGLGPRVFGQDKFPLRIADVDREHLLRTIYQLQLQDAQRAPIAKEQDDLLNRVCVQAKLVYKQNCIVNLDKGEISRAPDAVTSVPKEAKSK